MGLLVGCLLNYLEQPQSHWIVTLYYHHQGCLQPSLNDNHSTVKSITIYHNTIFCHIWTQLPAKLKTHYNIINLLVVWWFTLKSLCVKPHNQNKHQTFTLHVYQCVYLQTCVWGDKQLNALRNHFKWTPTCSKNPLVNHKYILWCNKHNVLKLQSTASVHHVNIKLMMQTPEILSLMFALSR